MIRIANGQGFWGDWLEAPRRLLEGGPLDYLVLDYLSEVTMAILQKQRQRDPSRGYASGAPGLIAGLLPQMLERGTRVVTNAGGVNPRQCARSILARAAEAGLGDVSVAVVIGDDLGGRIDEITATGTSFEGAGGRDRAEQLPEEILSAHAYIGAFPLAEALDSGANVVIAGRSTDTALTLAPMIHEFAWEQGDWDQLAAGTVAGHIVECGAQCTGGNCSFEWQAIPDLANIGFPVVEASPDGGFVVTKQQGTGGRVTVPDIKEQLLYELGDPRSYLTPDCRADFTSLSLRQQGPDRVAVEGVRGGPPPPTLKVSICYPAGFQAVGVLVYSWPDALEKARAAETMVRRRLASLRLEFEEIEAEVLGVNACHGTAAAPNPDPPEVQLRIGVRSAERGPAERFSREMIPLVLNGPPTATGFGEGRPRVREVVAHHPMLLPREAVRTKVEVFASR